MSVDTKKPARTGDARSFDNERVSELDDAESTTPQAVAQRADTNTTIKADLLNGASVYTQPAPGGPFGSASAVKVECERRMLGMQLCYGSPAVEAVKAEVGDRYELFDAHYDRIQKAVCDAHKAGRAVTANTIALALADDPAIIEFGAEHIGVMALEAIASPSATIRADIRKLANAWRPATQQYFREKRGAQVADAFSRADPSAFKDARDLEELIRSLDARSPETDYPSPLTGKELSEGEFPDVCYVVQDFILKDHVNLLSGDGGTGKTLLAQNFAVAISAGRDWCGRKTEQMPVVLVLAEDQKGPTKRRMEEICASYAVDLAALPITVWCLPGCDASIAHVTDDGQWRPGPFMQPLQGMLKQTGPCFLVLDTASDVALLDEAKRPPVNTFCKQVLGSLCRDFDVTILLNAHPSKAAMADGTGYSGSTAWNNAVRNRMVFEEMDQDGPGRILRVAKANYGPQTKVELYLDGSIFVTCEAPGRTKSDERKVVLRVALKLIDSGVQVVRANGNGQRPKDVAAAVFEQYGMRLSNVSVLEHLNYLERDGTLTYRQSDKNKHIPAGFRRGPKCPS